MTKSEKIKNFNPSDVGNTNAGMYGLPFTQDECEIQIVPVPWEVTVSYGGGTANGPYAILDASYQVDLYDPFVPNAWKFGIFFDDLEETISFKSHTLRLKAEKLIKELAKGKAPDKKVIEEINTECKKMNAWVKTKSLHFLNQNKTVGLLGGDHSTPLGMMQALAEKFGDFGILQIDAHADLRNAYEGFEFSHASIMFNALKIKEVKKLVQVGIRDYCDEELHLINHSKGRVHTFFDRDIKQAQYSGENWVSICDKIIATLPEKIYLSFDIDGLDPKLCPHTGTPVAGGFEAEQVLMLLEKVVKSGKKILAFDINEVTPGPKGDDWDANVAARLLYRIANLVAYSQGRKA
ncbi:MAG TPA: agmatinase family protein [Bacteroidia bacterium]|jgi:agmatinase|nr:agmatinase family protein [Bacteroidia bacterium]